MDKKKNENFFLKSDTLNPYNRSEEASSGDTTGIKYEPS